MDIPRWVFDPVRTEARLTEERAKNAAVRQRRLHRMAAEQQGLCTWCWLPLPADLSETEIDHIIPRCLGGPNARWNYQLLHRRCNGRGQHPKRTKGTRVTPAAQALAAEHGIILDDWQRI